MEAGSNVQDNCTVHVFPGKSCLIETDGHVGHGAVLHGCTVGRNALIGMNAVIMDDAVIGADSFVAAMSFVKAGMDVPPRSIVAGIPAAVKRELRDDEITWKSKGTAVYQELARRYNATLEVVDPLPEVTPDRATLPPIGYQPKHEQDG